MKNNSNGHTATHRLAVCGDGMDCPGVQKTVNFLRQRGIEPAVGSDGECAYLEYALPGDWEPQQTRKFMQEVEEVASTCRPASCPQEGQAQEEASHLAFHVARACAQWAAERYPGDPRSARRLARRALAFAASQAQWMPLDAFTPDEEDFTPDEDE